MNIFIFLSYFIKETNTGELSMDNSRVNSCGCCQQGMDRRRRDHSAAAGRSSENTSRMARSRECRRINFGERVDGLPLGMAYVPMQQYDQMFALDRGLMEGTIFPELCLPFCGRREKCPC